MATPFACAQDCNNISLVLSSREPEPEHMIGITVMSAATGMRIGDQRVKVYDTKTMETLEGTTNSQGWIQYLPLHPGTYRVIPLMSRWCSAEFTVKKRMLEVGDEQDLVWPSKYRYETGEPITFSVPTGVGVKVVRADGTLWQTLSVSRAGFGNFSVDEPGEYVLVVGAVSREFWGRNRSFEVVAAPTTTSTVNASASTTVTTTSIPESSMSSTVASSTTTSLVRKMNETDEESEVASGSDIGASLLRMALVALVVFLLGLVVLALWFARRTYRVANPKRDSAAKKKESAGSSNKRGGGSGRGGYRRYRPRHQ